MGCFLLERKCHFSLEPLELDEDEALELERIKAAPSPLEGKTFARVPCLNCSGGLSDGKCGHCGTEKYKTPEEAEPPVTHKDMLEQIVSAYDSTKRWSNPWYKDNLDDLIEEARKMIDGP